MAGLREPGRDCLVVDRDGDTWTFDDNGWSCREDGVVGETWEAVTEYGPLMVYAPIQTDDGAVTPGQSSGGSSPGRRPEASEVVSGPAPSSPRCDHSESMYGRCVACGMTWEQQADGRAGDPGGTPAHRGQQAGSIPASEPALSSPLRFELWRGVDVSGVSGTGVVAEGIQFSDRSVALRWRGAHPATAVWPSLDDVLAVHGHGGATVVRWIDGAVCRACGCSDETACAGGCWWVAADLCSQCGDGPIPLWPTEDV